MAAHAITSGTISFGLVTVPVKLYAATRPQNISFNLLHDKDKSRVRQQYVCSTCGETVDRQHMVRGYEYAKSQYVVLSEEELRRLEQNSDHTIDIQEFVPIATVDPVYFEKAYLLGPDKGGHKAYRLLCGAMKQAEMGAVAMFATRGRQQMVLLRQSRDGLMLHGLYYADEVRGFEDVDLGEAVTLRPNEIELAVQLVKQLATESFEPGKYEDEYRKKVLDVVQQKVAGEEVVAAAAPPPRAQVIDIMEALKASLAARRPPVAAAAGARKPVRVKSRAAAARKSVRAK
jgi:DNA end-binding protein Ku